MRIERNNELLEAYKATHYTVGTDMILRINEPCPPLDELLHSYGADAAAYLTAWNPWSEMRSPEANAEANRRLREDLDSIPNVVTVLLGKGVDPLGDWPGEESYLAIGLNLSSATDLAERYGQNAFVHYRSGGVAQLVLTREFGTEGSTDNV
jgi:hypothetical protein